MAGKKYYPYRGEVDEEIEEALEAISLSGAPLFTDTFGHLYAQEYVDEFHPDDKGAARVIYQSLGIEV